MKRKLALLLVIGVLSGCASNDILEEVAEVSEESEFISENIEEVTQVLFDNNWASGDFEQAVRMMESLKRILLQSS